MCVASAPRPVMPSSSDSLSVHRAIRDRRSVVSPAETEAPRRGRSQRSRARTVSGSGAVPGSRAASRARTRWRTSGAAERSSSGPSADRARPLASWPPTRPEVRVAASQAVARCVQRSCAGSSAQSSYAGVGAYRSSASPSEASSPAAKASSAQKAATGSGTSRVVAVRFSSRTLSPCGPQYRGAAAVPVLQQLLDGVHGQERLTGRRTVHSLWIAVGDRLHGRRPRLRYAVGASRPQMQGGLAGQHHGAGRHRQQQPVVAQPLHRRGGVRGHLPVRRPPHQPVQHGQGLGRGGVQQLAHPGPVGEERGQGGHGGDRVVRGGQPGRGQDLLEAARGHAGGRLGDGRPEAGG